MAPHCGRLCARQAGHADLRLPPALDRPIGALKNRQQLFVLLQCAAVSGQHGGGHRMLHRRHPLLPVSPAGHRRVAPQAAGHMGVGGNFVPFDKVARAVAAKYGIRRVFSIGIRAGSQWLPVRLRCCGRAHSRGAYSSGGPHRGCRRSLPAHSPGISATGALPVMTARPSSFSGVLNSAQRRCRSAMARPTQSCGTSSRKSYQGSSRTACPRAAAVRSPCRTAR